MSLYCAKKLPEYADRYRAEHGGHRSDARPAISLGVHVRLALAPIAGLAVIAVLQNIDIIAAKHRFSSHTATSYAAVAVAAKVLIWVAIGAGFYLVPEVSRRRSPGEDTRPILFRAIGIVVVCAIPCLLIFAFGAKLLITDVFGAKKATAYHALLPLGAAFSVPALTYPRDPVPAGAEANVVPTRDRGGRAGRAVPAAARLEEPEQPSRRWYWRSRPSAAVFAFAIALWRRSGPATPSAGARA